MNIDGKEYRAEDFDSFLNDAMKAINAETQHKRDDLDKRFRRAMTAAYDLFGLFAFRKRVTSPALPINKPLFETWSVNLDKLTDMQMRRLIDRRLIVREKLTQIFQNNDFNSAISLSTGDINKVKRRFRAIEKLIVEVLE